MLRILGLPGVLALSAAAAFGFLGFVYFTGEDKCRPPSGGTANALLARPIVEAEAEAFARNLGFGSGGAGLAFSSSGYRGALVVTVVATQTFKPGALRLALSQECDGGEWKLVAREGA